MGSYSSGNAELDHFKQLKVNRFHSLSSFHIYIYVAKVGEGDGTLLQYSCLENSMGGGAW